MEIPFKYRQEEGYFLNKEKLVKLGDGEGGKTGNELDNLKELKKEKLQVQKEYQSTKLKGYKWQG